jgi:hypothetical protein
MLLARQSLEEKTLQRKFLLEIEKTIKKQKMILFYFILRFQNSK